MVFFKNKDENILINKNQKKRYGEKEVNNIIKYKKFIIQIIQTIKLIDN